MKVCDKCGAYNADERFFCVDCAEKLGDPLSDDREKQLRDGVSGRIDRLYNRKDPLHVTVFDKILGVTALAGAGVSLVAMVVDWLTAYTFAYLWVALLLLLLTAVEALVPRVTWELEKMRLSLYINASDDAEPSGMYMFGRKAATVLTLAMGVLMLLESLANV